MTSHQHKGHLIVTEGDSLEDASDTGRWLASDLVMEARQ